MKLWQKHNIFIYGRCCLPGLIIAFFDFFTASPQLNSTCLDERSRTALTERCCLTTLGSVSCPFLMRRTNSSSAASFRPLSVLLDGKYSHTPLNWTAWRKMGEREWFLTYPEPQYMLSVFFFGSTNFFFSGIFIGIIFLGKKIKIRL